MSVSCSHSFLLLLLTKRFLRVVLFLKYLFYDPTAATIDIDENQIPENAENYFYFDNVVYSRTEYQY